MVRTRIRAAAIVAVVVSGALGVAWVLPRAAAVEESSTEAARTYVVVAKDVDTMSAAESAVIAAGGVVTSEDAELGLLTARSSQASFAEAADADSSVFGVVAERRIGSIRRRDWVMDEVRVAQGAGEPLRTVIPKAEPLADLQWGMAMIGATPSGSYARQQGSKDVLVGVIDTGVDGTHPDIKPNFSLELSRNFVIDNPAIDGPCEHPSCVDPVDEDDEGHGTHVAGTIGAPINGIGIAGVAPKVTLVNIRAGQDSGSFFLGPTVKALRYAADAGIDVVNMSFFIDPWFFNCSANPADSPTEQAEQRAVIEATQRALEYATQHGVTMVSSLGNQHIDLGDPGVDKSSPNSPGGAERARTIDNATCLNLPPEGTGVISVSAIGPDGKKADYSNYGLEQNDVSAPGGFHRGFADDPAKARRPENLVLAPMPHNVALASGSVDAATGEPTDPLVISSCTGADPASCTYWQYLQGTSMAAPHVAGVAALIVAQYGGRDSSGMIMSPENVAEVLKRTATDVSCPAPVITYAAEGLDSSFDAPCVGTAARNSIFGDGVVNALRAVGG